MMETSSVAWAPFPREALLIAGAGGDKFHMMDCEWVDWIAHSRYYISCEEAQASGYRPCRTCQPLRRHPVILRTVPPDLLQEALRRREERVRERSRTFPRSVVVQFADDEVMTFRLVGEGEMGDGRERISISSPMGMAVRYAKVGDTIEYESSPGVTETITILEYG